LWNSRTVRSILRGKVYYGAYVAHRMERVKVGKDRAVQVPEEEQIVIEGMHEPIVTKEEYLEVQKRMTKTYRKPAGPLHYPLRGKVKCGTCGRSCRRMTKNPWKNPHQVYLCQFSKRQKGSVALEGHSCSGDDIDEKALEEIVWNAIRKMIALSDEAKRRIAEGLKKVERDQAALEKELIKAKKDKEKAETEKVQLTERFLMEKLSVEAYQRERLKPDMELSQAERKIGEIKQKLDELKDCQNREVSRDVEKLQAYAGAEELTEEIVGALVEKVLFYKKGHFEIKWRFSEEFLKMVGKEDD